MGKCFPPGPRERGKDRERQRRLRQKQTCGPLLDACLPLLIGTSQCMYTIYTCIDARRQSYPCLLEQACRRLPSSPTLRASQQKRQEGGGSTARSGNACHSPPPTLEKRSARPDGRPGCHRSRRVSRALRRGGRRGQRPTARSCKKRLSFAACPAAAAGGSNQHKAGRQARHGLAELPHLPYIVNLGVTTELPTDHKAPFSPLAFQGMSHGPVFSTRVLWAKLFLSTRAEGERERERTPEETPAKADLRPCLMLACL